MKQFIQIGIEISYNAELMSITFLSFVKDIANSLTGMIKIGVAFVGQVYINKQNLYIKNSTLVVYQNLLFSIEIALTMHLCHMIIK